MASTTAQYHADKFEPLNLPPIWEEAAAHVDYQLSNPETGSYKTELGATWRSLQPIVQRSYVVVAAKKAEAQIRKRPGRRMPGTAEAHMVLLNNVFELLWVTPNPNADAKKRSSPRKSSQWLSAVTRVDANTTATVKPLSPAWHCLSEAGHSIPQRLRLDVDPCRSVPSRISRAVSPLARFAPVTADEIEAEQEIEDHFNCFVYSDDSDTASDWSARE